MENQKKHIEITVDLCAETASIRAENVTDEELIDGYVHAAVAVADAIVENSNGISKQEVIRDITVRFLQTYCCLDSDDKEDNQ